MSTRPPAAGMLRWHAPQAWTRTLPLPAIRPAMMAARPLGGWQLPLMYATCGSLRAVATGGWNSSPRSVASSV